MAMLPNKASILDMHFKDMTVKAHQTHHQQPTIHAHTPPNPIAHLQHDARADTGVPYGPQLAAPLLSIEGAQPSYKHISWHTTNSYDLIFYATSSQFVHSPQATPLQLLPAATCFHTLACKAPLAPAGL
jgi:hypothetical protein